MRASGCVPDLELDTIEKAAFLSTTASDVSSSMDISFIINQAEEKFCRDANEFFETRQHGSSSSSSPLASSSNGIDSEEISTRAPIYSAIPEATESLIRSVALSSATDGLLSLTEFCLAISPPTSSLTEPSTLIEDPSAPPMHGNAMAASQELYSLPESDKFSILCLSVAFLSFQKCNLQTEQCIAEPTIELGSKLEPLVEVVDVVAELLFLGELKSEFSGIGSANFFGFELEDATANAPPCGDVLAPPCSDAAAEAVKEREPLVSMVEEIIEMLPAEVSDVTAPVDDLLDTARIVSTVVEIIPSLDLNQSSGIQIMHITTLSNNASETADLVDAAMPIELHHAGPSMNVSAVAEMVTSLVLNQSESSGFQIMHRTTRFHRTSGAAKPTSPRAIFNRPGFASSTAFNDWSKQTMLANITALNKSVIARTPNITSLDSDTLILRSPSHNYTGIWIACALFGPLLVVLVALVVMKIMKHFAELWIYSASLPISRSIRVATSSSSLATSDSVSLITPTSSLTGSDINANVRPPDDDVTSDDIYIRMPGHFPVESECKSDEFQGDWSSCSLIPSVSSSSSDIDVALDALSTVAQSEKFTPSTSPDDHSPEIPTRNQDSLPIENHPPSPEPERFDPPIGDAVIFLAQSQNVVYFPTVQKKDAEADFSSNWKAIVMSDASETNLPTLDVIDTPGISTHFSHDSVGDLDLTDHILLSWTDDTYEDKEVEFTTVTRSQSRRSGNRLKENKLSPSAQKLSSCLATPKAALKTRSVYPQPKMWFEKYRNWAAVPENEKQKMLEKVRDPEEFWVKIMSSLYEKSPPSLRDGDVLWA